MFDDILYCRSCGISKSENFVDLESKYEDNKIWSDIFYECIGINIKQDLYSRSLCDLCSKNLIIAYELRQMCYQTNEKLIKHVESMKIKAENEDYCDSRLTPTNGRTWIDDDDDENVDDYDYKPVQSNPVSNSKSTIKQALKSTHKKKKKKSKLESVDKIWICLANDCNKKFNSYTDLHDHYETMKDQLNHQWRCDLCNRNFYLKSFMLNHIKKLHKEVSCEKCNKIFIGANSLQTHNKEFHKEKLKTCSICAKVFASTRSLRLHINYKHEEMNFTCHYCGKKFGSKTILTNHERIHTNERPFVCNIDGCGKRFKNKSQLSVHEPTHCTTQEYSCDVCGVRIKSKYYLTKHRKVHFYDKQFSCDICGLEFARPSYVTGHKKNVHSIAETVAVCTECGKTFKNQKSLNTHMNIHRDTDHVCQICNKMFSRKTSLNEHISATHDKNRKWICTAEGCDKAYFKSSHLRHHQRVIHGKSLANPKFGGHK